ncbi:DUF58 domain-containing protein [Vibrio sp. FNV 38]|nr:DUF58 domain-containing protein [Vibrio sp. FNV 38]
MIKPTHSPKPQPHDPRVYCDYAQLVRIQSQVGAFNLLPNAKVGTQLDGRHTSKLRGRGLNFEELRHYHLGDDIRNLDWKVTLRTGKPHVRGYTEEKDRNVVICVDQRSSMFFATQSVMKSVIACEVAALIGWRALKESDRISCMLLSDKGLQHTKATRTQASFLSFLKTLSQRNQTLNAQTPRESTSSISDMIKHLSRSRCREATIIIISDWADVSKTDIDRLNSLQRSNDIIPVLVTDPIEQQLPENFIQQQWRVGDGDHQISLERESQRRRINTAFEAKSAQTTQRLSRLITSKGLPLIELSTEGEHIKRFTQRIGGNA